MYKINFITDVIVKLDFNLPIEIKDDSILTNFKDGLDLPDVELISTPVNKFLINMSDHSQHEFSLVGLQGMFNIGKTKRSFLLNPKFLTYTAKYSESNEYKNIESIETEFSKGLRSLNTIKEDLLVRRFGLRFINKIKLPDIKEPSSWKDYINNKYISYYGDTVPDKLKEYNLRRKMNSTYLSDGSYIIRINVGIWNSSFPGMIVDNDFIIDVDCYVDSTLLDYNDMKGKIPEMSNIIYDVFNDIVNDNLKSIMEKIKDE